jgi:hypothetical protein
MYEFIYRYGTLKPVEIILRRGMGEEGNNGGDEPNWVGYTYIWKYHNETPCIAIIY